MKVMGPMGLVVGAVFMFLGVSQVITMENTLVSLTSGPLASFIQTFDFLMLLMVAFVVVVGLFLSAWAAFGR